MTENANNESGGNSCAAVLVSEGFCIKSTPVPVPVPTSALVITALRKLHCSLPHDWLCTVESQGFCILFISSQKVKAIQRQISISFLGEVNAYIHGKPCSRLDEVFRYVHSPIEFSYGTLDNYCESILALVEVVSQYTICVGANHQAFEELWTSVPNTYIDQNPYHEESYKITLRSSVCARVVSFESEDVRCEHCTDVLTYMRENKREGP